jgi:hypothetical protein
MRPGERAVRFIRRHCVHGEGDWYGQPVNLSDFQAGLIRTFYDGGYRRAYWGLPRGSGKTELVAALAMYELLGGVHQSPSVAVAAASWEQADLVFGVMKVMGQGILDARAPGRGLRQRNPAKGRARARATACSRGGDQRGSPARNAGVRRAPRMGRRQGTALPRPRERLRQEGRLAAVPDHDGRLRHLDFGGLALPPRQEVGRWRGTRRRSSFRVERAPRGDGHRRRRGPRGDPPWGPG